jgi:hypothetical protein
MGRWREIKDGKGNGKVTLHIKEDGKKLVACIDEVLTGRTQVTSFLRSDGELIEVKKSRQKPSHIVINRVGGNWRRLDPNQARNLRDSIVRSLS